MSLVLWYAESSQAVRDLARSLLMDNNLQLRFWESFKFPEVEPNDLVLVLGDKMKPVLEVPKCIPKNRTISSLRERVHSCPQLPHFMLTYHPSIRDVDHAKGVEVVCDFQLAKRFAMKGSLEPQLGDYQYPDSLKEFRAEVEALYEQSGKPVPVSFDLETLGVNQFDPSAYILNLSLSHTERTATALSFTPLTQPHPQDPTSLEGQIWWDLHWLLNTNHVSIRGANLKFDLIWIAVKWGITCTNFKFDTLLVGSLLDENRSNSLKVHAKVYTDLGSYSDAFDQKYDKGRMDLIPEDERLLYAASDADATLRVAKIEAEQLQRSPMLTRFYVKVLHPAARAFEKVEQCGVYVDTVKYQQLQAEVENALDVYEKKALACVPRRLIAKWGEKASLTKAHFLADYMFSPTGLGLTPKKFTLKTNSPSTAMDHFEMFGDDERAKPFVEQLKAFNSAKKTLSTYIVGFLKHLQPDGRFHPTYFLANQGDVGGTNTGRLSAKDPAFQTVPKHTLWAKKLRKCFVAPPGFVILGPDYSQGELKIAACLANEPTMIDAYSKGIDLHAVTAAGIAGWELEEFMDLKDNDPDKYDEVRQLGKAGNFGLIYGMGANGFQIYAETSYGVVMTLEQAEEARNKFFDTYPLLLDWHKVCKSHARKYKQIHSPLGRVRHLPLIHSPIREVAAKSERQCVNSPVQSTLSDMSLWATALMDKEYGMDVNGFCVIGMIHDQLLAYAPEDEAELWAGRMKEVMENLPFHEVDWEPQLKFTVDMTIGHNLADLKKWSKPGDWQPEGV